jgi:hypothetical protein
MSSISEPDPVNNCASNPSRANDVDAVGMEVKGVLGSVGYGADKVASVVASGERSIAMTPCVGRGRQSKKTNEEKDAKLHEC